MKKLIMCSLSIIMFSSLYCMDDYLKNDAQAVLIALKDLSSTKLQHVLDKQPIISLAQLEQAILDLADKLYTISFKLSNVPPQQTFDIQSNAQLVQRLGARAIHCTKMITELRTYLLATNDSEGYATRAINLCNNNFINTDKKEDVTFVNLVKRTYLSLSIVNNKREQYYQNESVEKCLTLLAAGKLPKSDILLETMRTYIPNFQYEKTK